MQQRAVQHAMAGLQVLLEPEQPSTHADADQVSPKISLPSIHLITHAATLQLQRNSTTVNLRYAPEPSVRLENVRLALALLSNLATYRMWSTGVLQFLKIVVTVMQMHERDARVQLEGARIFAKHCQLCWNDAYDAVNRSGGRDALVELICSCSDAASPHAANPQARADILAAACHALRLLLEATLKSAYSREEQDMENRRVVMTRASVNSGAIEAVVGVLASHYEDADTPPPQIVNALALLPVFFVSNGGQNYERFVLADGIGALVALLRRHRDGTLAFACLSLLRATYCKFANRRTTHGGDLLVGQLDTVIQTMADHMDRPQSVLVAGCSVMATFYTNMRSNHATTDPSLFANHLAPLTAILRRHPDDVKAQGAAILALGLFVHSVRPWPTEHSTRPWPTDVTSGPEYDHLCVAIKAVADAGGLALVMHALRKHLADAMVRTKACYLLAMLCTDAAVTASITTSGATELALAALTHQHADAYGRYTAALLLDVIAQKPAGFRGHW